MEFTTEAGTRVRIRPVRAADKPLLRAFVACQSDHSLRDRFLAPKPRLTQSELRYLTEVDGRDHHALVAVAADDGARMLGVARYVRVDSDRQTAEMAVMVDDAHHGQGLGRCLVMALADHARAGGVRRFVASMHSDNAPAHRLLSRLAATMATERAGHGVDELSAELYALPLARRDAPAPLAA